MLRRRARRDGLRDRLRQPGRGPRRARLRRREPVCSARRRRSSPPRRSSRSTCWSSTWTSPEAPRRRRGARRASASAPRDRGPRRAGTVADPLDEIAEVYEALVTGTRDYLAKNGFRSAVIALSGGIDSSLVATVAVDALGPTPSSASRCPRGTARALAGRRARSSRDRLGIRFVVAPIEPAHVALAGVLDPVLGGEPDGLTDENLQSRIRGVLLMGISNATGAIVLTTGNKSELATGYTTLYGDSVGGLRGHQGRGQDARLRAVPLPQRARRRRGATSRRSPSRSSTSRRPPSCAPTSATTTACPPYDAARPGARGVRRGGPHASTSSSPRASTPRSWSASPRSSTPRSTSGARWRRACASRRSRSARTAACRSRTATGAGAAP